VEKRPIGARQKYAALRWYGEPQNTPRQARRISDWGEAHAKTPPPPKNENPPETGGHALATDTPKYGREAYTAKIRPPTEKTTAQDALQRGENEAVGVRYHTTLHHAPKPP